MAIWGDYHTHTVFSHGHGSIEDNVKAAIKMGLKEIAITDHGFSHNSYGVRRMDVAKMLEEIAYLNAKYPNIKVYAGLESNLLGLDGRVDILEEDYEWLDVLVCGYHKFTRGGEIIGNNFFTKLFGERNASKRMIKNTDAYIKAMDRYRINIISHPNYGVKTDVRAIARAAKEHGVYMELNGKRVSMTDDEICSIVEEGATLIVDSDAHSSEKVGNFSVPLSFVERLHIPGDSIANMDKLPDFGRKK